MQLTDYEVKPLDNFLGLWSRGTDDQCPLDHFLDCLNVDYDEGQVNTRPGWTVAITPGFAGGITRRFTCFFNSVGIIHLILDNAGNLYTFSTRSGDTATTPLINVPGATDFSAIQLYNRIYIAFHDGQTGISGVNLKVYIPNAAVASDIIRDAAGPAPTASNPMVAAAGAAGLMNIGRYKIAVANITTTGFITPPGPKITSVFTPTIYNAGGKTAATGALTFTDKAFTGETVTIGPITYTFRSPLTTGGTVANEIKVVTSGSASQNISDTIANLARAIMGTGAPGVEYGVGTLNPGVSVFSVGFVLYVVAREPGLEGNSFVTTETCFNGSWGAATLTGGANGNKIHLTVIPLGPTGTAQRQILITKVDEEEYFFLPSAFGGLIPNNTAVDTTVSGDLQFDDTTDLVDSADYLFDLLETIPAPVGLNPYEQRLITYGEAGNDSVHRASLRGEPESFDNVDGIVQISKDDGFVCTNALEMRGAMYAGKSLGVFSYQDNGDIPANWRVDPIDRSINICSHGISEFFAIDGVHVARDLVFVTDRSGILIFDGNFRKPPLTYKIDKLWQRLNFAAYKKTVLVVDEQIHKIYCAFPIDAATENDTLIVGDYSSCGDIPDPFKIKWSVYSTSMGGVKRPTALGLTAIFGEKIPTLKFGSLDGSKIWKRDPTVTLDEASVIENYIESALLFFNDGAIHFFTAIQMRIVGAGNLEITVKGEDNILPKSLFTVAGSNPVVLSTSAGKHVTCRFSFVNEKAKFKLRLASGTFTLSTIKFYGKSMYSMRPA